MTWPDRLMFVLTLAAALGSGTIGGVFFAFSTFVMRALARLPSRDAIAAMQSINVAVINPMFLGPFFGTALGCAVALVAAAVRWDRPGSGYLVAGAVFYVAGTFAVTIFRNVPLNDALEGVAPTDADIAAQWSRYAARWTTWNHVRTAAALAACAAFALALRG